MQLSDFATLAEAQAYELITDKKQIGSGQARGFFVNNGIWTTLRQIQADIANPLFALADAVIVTASDASSYFGLDATTAEGLGNLAAADVMVAAGIMTEAQKGTLLALALKSTHPHVNATQKDFDEATNPAPLTMCEHGGQDYVVSISGKDLFGFVTTTLEPMSNLSLTMYWREDNEAVWKQYQSPFILQSGNGVLSQVIRRPSGINAARHFKFEYTANHTGQIASIVVSVGQ